MIIYQNFFIHEHIYVQLYISRMNRKNKEKENRIRNDENIRYIEPIPPKFSANWAQNIRFDKIIINVSDCQYEVVQRVAKELKWKIKKDQNNPDWDIWWTDWHVQAETLLKMEHHQKINHFPGMFNLSRKNLLAKNLMRMRKKSPQDYNFFPLTWNIPLDLNQFKSYYENKPKGKSRTYIVKPESMSQGKGIFLTKKIQDIPLDQKSVVQRYISRPYLVDGLKFDLRIYVLVAGVDPLRVFVYHQGLARFATEAYVIPNKDNMQDICMHLTNYAINKESQKFVFNQDDTNMNIGHKRSLTSIFSLLQEKGCDIKELKSRINQMIVKTLISGLSHLKFQYRSCQRDNFRGDMCFQILGFDVILNDQLEPYLLQINYTPSFTTDTPLDENIKKNLIKDTLKVMGINKQFKQKTVLQRKQHRNNRMMTGKTTKITNQERKQKMNKAVQERDAYISQNLGDFTQIYPLDASAQENKQIMEKYNKLMELEDDLIQTKKKQAQKEQKPPKKVQKLPILTSMKEVPPRSVNSKKSCKNITKFKNRNQLTLNEFSLQKRRSTDEYNNNNNDLTCVNQLSQKIIKNVRVREQILPKKKVSQREALVLKPIQFEGGKFDGLCDNFKQAIALQTRRE